MSVWVYCTARVADSCVKIRTAIEVPVRTRSTGHLQSRRSFSRRCVLLDVLPEHICGGHQESTRFFVSVTEGAGDADRGFLQTLAAEADAALGTLIRHEEAVDVLVTVTESDHALLIHLAGLSESREQLLVSSADPVSDNTTPEEQRDLFAASVVFPSRRPLSHDPVLLLRGCTVSQILLTLSSYTVCCMLV